MTSRKSAFGVLFAATFAAPLGAQTATIPIRTLPPPDARSTASLAEPFGVRELTDGRLIVNDAGARRVLLFDATLAAFTILADTTVGATVPYGPRATSIIAYPGDSTLLVDILSRAFAVLAPNGRSARTMAAPRTSDVAWLANASYGAPGIDPRGRLVYRAFPAFKDDSATQAPNTIPLDSAPIVRADFDTRRADTIALLGVPRPQVSRQRMTDGRTVLQLTVNPLPLIDDWALLPDGAIAILRGHDYHLDWIAADGARTSTPKMPFDWRRLSQEDKQAIVDSTKRAIDSTWAVTQRTTPSGGGPVSSNARAGGAAMGSASNTNDKTNDNAPRTVAVPTPAPEVVHAAALPDYIPPVLRAGTMRADPAGRVWILPSTSANAGGGYLYDVVSREGVIVERVRIPAGRTLAGFGARGAIYLTARDNTGTHLERIRMNRTQ